MMENNLFVSMSDDELMDVNGGAWWIIAGIIIVGGAVFCIGAYNGYRDTARGG